MFRANIYKTRAEAQPQQIRKIIWKNGRTVVVYVIKHNWRSLLRCQARKCSSPTLMSVPFHKSYGSLRPIAVVDPMYRICAKAVLKATLGSKFILPFPMGFRSAGGVEQIVSAVWANASFIGCLSHASFFSNASNTYNGFNRIDRMETSTVIVTDTPKLYQTCKWSYSNPSGLAREWWAGTILLPGGSSGKCFRPSSSPQSDTRPYRICTLGPIANQMTLPWRGLHLLAERRQSA